MGLAAQVLSSPRLRSLALESQWAWRPLVSLAAPAINVALPIRARGRHILHFGCGMIDDHRFINVDALPLPHVHYVTRSPKLRRIRSSSLEGFYACHVLEHFPHQQVDEILRQWVRLLRPGGWMRIAVPDFERIVADYESEGRRVESIVFDLMGSQNYPGAAHLAIFNRERLFRALDRAGLEGIREWTPEPSWPQDYSRAPVSLNLEGWKPSQPTEMGAEQG